MSFAAPPLLLRYQRQSERQTAEVISEEILLSKAYIENIGGTMLGVCTDNASNMRAVSRLVPGAVWLGCMAHSAELLSRDLWGLRVPKRCREDLHSRRLLSWPCIPKVLLFGGDGQASGFNFPSSALCHKVGDLCKDP